MPRLLLEPSLPGQAAGGRGLPGRLLPLLAPRGRPVPRLLPPGNGVLVLLSVGLTQLPDPKFGPQALQFAGPASLGGAGAGQCREPRWEPESQHSVLPSTWGALRARQSSQVPGARGGQGRGPQLCPPTLSWADGGHPNGRAWAQPPHSPLLDVCSMPPVGDDRKGVGPGGVSNLLT